MSIKRRVVLDGNVLDTMELTYLERSLPDIVPIKRFEFPLVPIIPKPTRCFACQRYRHVSGQCRSHTRCEYCGQAHNTRDCENQLLSPRYCNCNGTHLASFMDCPVYIRENKIVIIKTEQACNYKVAEEIYKKETTKDTSTLDENSTIKGKVRIG